MVARRLTEGDPEPLRKTERLFQFVTVGHRQHRIARTCEQRLDLPITRDRDLLRHQRRGLSGIVAAKNGKDIIFKVRGPQGDIQQTVTVSDKTVFKRYAAGSVSFEYPDVSITTSPTGF